MDIEFRETPIACLREQAVEVLYQEETAELIIPDSYPDVQAVVDCGAVGCLRDQEVQAGSLTASGSFQACVLYIPEEGEPCLLESWMPFTARLNREEIRSESLATSELRIRGVDARILNSHKLVLRVSYAIRLTAYERTALRIRDAAPDDALQLRRTKERGTFPVACAERNLTVSELVELPPLGAEVRKILKAVPEIQFTDRKITDGSAVLKGCLALHLLYQLENETLGCFDIQIPISQYLDFDEPVEGGTIRLCASLTDFQLEREEGWMVTAGIRVQAVVWRQVELPLICDGYCVGRSFEAEYEPIRILEALDAPTVAKTAEGMLHGNMQRLIDSTAFLDFPVCRRSKDEITVTAAVTMHALYYDAAGRLCGESVRSEESGTFALSEGAVCFADAEAGGSCYASVSGEARSVCCAVNLTARCFAEKQMQTMVSAAVGEPLAADENRPSLIVRRAAAGSLWEIAKTSGTTVRAICEANGLEGEQLDEPMLLLIPMT